MAKTIDKTAEPASPKKKEFVRACSFCGKPSTKCCRLIAGPNNIFICDECVTVCVKILFQEMCIAAIPQHDRPAMLAEFLGIKNDFPPIDFKNRSNKSVFIAPKGGMFSTIFSSFLSPLGNQYSVPVLRIYSTYKDRFGMGKLIKRLYESSLVIVDVTGKDPGVMYLLGIVKSLGRPLFIITQNLADIPTDLKEGRHIKYDETEESLLDIQNQLVPVFEFIEHGKMILSTKNLKRNQKKSEKQKKGEITKV
jgi:hypothetical protein